jgi:hypothetical protein
MNGQRPHELVKVVLDKVQQAGDALAALGMLAEDRDLPPAVLARALAVVENVWAQLDKLHGELLNPADPQIGPGDDFESCTYLDTLNGNVL